MLKGVRRGGESPEGKGRIFKTNKEDVKKKGILKKKNVVSYVEIKSVMGRRTS